MESARAWAAAGRRRMLLSDTTARYEELNEGQLGGVVLADGRTVIANFGSKCGAAPTALQAVTGPSSGAALLADSVPQGHGVARLPTAPWRYLGHLRGSRRLGLRRARSPPPWQAAMATWPVAVHALAHRLCAADSATHRLPISRPWLLRDSHSHRYPGGDSGPVPSTQVTDVASVS